MDAANDLSCASMWDFFKSSNAFVWNPIAILKLMKKKPVPFKCCEQFSLVNHQEIFIENENMLLIEIF